MNRENIGETIDVMQGAMMEIQRLRRENEILTAKVSVMELFRDALRGSVPQGEGTMQIDPLWILDKHLSELQRLSKVTSRLRGQPDLQKAQVGQAEQVAEA